MPDVRRTCHSRAVPNLDSGNQRSLCSSRVSGLRDESVINVSQLVAVDRSYLVDHVGKISHRIQALVLQLGSLTS
jgi:hypothetical protein